MQSSTGVPRTTSAGQGDHEPRSSLQVKNGERPPHRHRAALRTASTGVLYNGPARRALDLSQVCRTGIAVVAAGQNGWRVELKGLPLSTWALLDTQASPGREDPDSASSVRRCEVQVADGAPQPGLPDHSLGRRAAATGPAAAGARSEGEARRHDARRTTGCRRASG